MSNDLGIDRSGNGNNWTVNNITYADQAVDNPTNNFCTLNPIYWNPVRSNIGTYSEGNLKQANTADCMSEGTMAAASGKWYYEVLQAGDVMFGAGVPGKWGGDNPGCNDWGIGSHSGGVWYGESSSGATTHTSYTTGDIVGIAFDVDAKKIWMSKNGTWSGANPSTGNSAALFNYAGSYSLIPAMRTSNGNNEYTIANFGQDSSFAGAKTAQGNQDGNSIGDFYYTPPTGFLALCTSNLPDVDVKPSKNFNTITYTGTGLANNPQTVGFQPDFVWFKSRSAARAHVLVDAVRGVTKELVTNTTNAEQTSSATQDLTAFTSTGFTLGTPYNNSPNESGASIVAWNWKANGSGSSGSNVTGVGSCTVSVNIHSGFSIAEWTSTQGGPVSYGHGLSQTPEMIITKSVTDSDYWSVGHKDLGWTKALNLNDPRAAVTSSSYWNDTAPTSTIVTLGGGVNNNKRFICYAFHSVDGYSKIGSYTGNGSTDGTFVYTGFRPAFILHKKTNGSANWIMTDAIRNTSNPVGKYLMPNSSNAEADGTSFFDYTSNGFKLRTSGGGQNGSGDTHIFIAFAETPFKYSNAR